MACMSTLNRDLDDYHQRNGSSGREPRSLPFSEDAEKGVLCSLLLDPREVSDMCRSVLSESAFYIPAHAIVFQTILELVDSGRSIDFVIVRQALRDRSALEEIGGVEALSELLNFIPTAANAEFYIKIVREKFMLRRLIQTCGKIAQECYEEQQDEIAELMDRAENAMFQITSDGPEFQTVSMKTRVLDAVDRIASIYQARGEIAGLSTGFSDLDKLTGGLQPGEMIVLAGRPSMGKTALAMNIAEYVASELKKPVAIFSLEMGADKLAERMLCSRAKIDLQKLRDGFFRERDFTALTQVASQIADAPLYVDDSANLTIAELKARARRLKSRHDIQLVVIDYLQLLRAVSRKAQENRQIEITEISCGIKALAKELRIPVIVLAQLNRQPEARVKEGGRPRLSDLRESGSIEQDADVVGLLYRAEYYEADEDVRTEKAGEAELILAKQRNGPTGEVPLTFLRQFTRFENRARAEAMAHRFDPCD
jgi:replicative DNA helicase